LTVVARRSSRGVATFNACGVYEECAGGVARIHWYGYAGETRYTEIFDETGALAFYDAQGYLILAGCSTSPLWHVTAGMLPPLTDCRGCRICGADDGGNGGQGGIGAEALAELPACVIDTQRRIALPP
jgi:hypothetical protein